MRPVYKYKYKYIQLNKFEIYLLYDVILKFQNDASRDSLKSYDYRQAIVPDIIKYRNARPEQRESIGTPLCMAKFKFLTYRRFPIIKRSNTTHIC